MRWAAPFRAVRIAARVGESQPCDSAVLALEDLEDLEPLEALEDLEGG
jgi:hypothetical protein